MAACSAASALILLRITPTCWPPLQHLVVLVLGDGHLCGGGRQQVARQPGRREGEAVHVLAGHRVHGARLAQCRALRLRLRWRLHPVAVMLGMLALWRRV